MVMHSNASVVYPEPITKIQARALSGLAEVQARALIDMRNRLGAFASIIAPDVHDLWEECEYVLEHGSADLHPASIKWTIEEYAGATNRDEDLALIALLLDWTECRWSAAQPLIALGISSFHTVWEDMCRQAVSSFGEAVTHAQIASQPSYVLEGQELLLAPQRPDILLRRGQSAIMADAKWYILDDKALPQTPDAIKQFAYELSIAAGTSVHANLLLLPSEIGDKWSIAGSLNMKHSGLLDSRFPPVSLISLNWHHMARLYVQHQRLPDQFFDQMIALRGPDPGVEMRQSK